MPEDRTRLIAHYTYVYIHPDYPDSHMGAHERYINLLETCTLKMFHGHQQTHIHVHVRYKELLGSSNEKAVLYLAEKHVLGP